MNSRERVLSSIEHREPDCIPIDLGSNPSSGISAIAYNSLKNHYGIKNGQTYVYDLVQQLAQPEDEILDLLGVDVVDIGREFVPQNSELYDVTLLNGSTAKYPRRFSPVKNKLGDWEVFAEDGTCIAKMPKHGTFFDQTYFPYIDGYPDHYRNLTKAMSKVLWQAMAHSPWDSASKPDFWEQLRQRALALRQKSDRAIMISCGCNLFEWGTFLRRIDNFMMDVYTDPDDVERLLDALMEIHLNALEKVCNAVSDVVDIIRFGDDLGMDTGPFMSPDIYRKLFKPRHKILCDYVKKNSRMYIFLHSCGSIYKLIPDLIEVGYDIFNPVQTNCTDMDPLRLKKEFGNDITFWGGGCDTRFVLNNATPQEIEDHVKEQIDIFAPGGGFVFNPIHNILPDVPAQNIITAFNTASSYGKYTPLYSDTEGIETKRNTTNKSKRIIKERIVVNTDPLDKSLKK